MNQAIPDWMGIGATLFLIVGFIVQAVHRRWQPASRPNPTRRIDPLDWTVFRWTDRDFFSWRDLLKSVLCLGATGSGKTSSVAKLMIESIICKPPNLMYPRAALLGLAAKPEDVHDWKRHFARAGRAEDLLIFAPGSGLCFNVLDYIVKCGGSCRDITRCLIAISETVRPKDGSGEDSKFFEDLQERIVYDAVVMLKLGTGGVNAPDLQRFLLGTANTPFELTTEAWREGFQNQMIRRAVQANKTQAEVTDFEIAKGTFLSELPALADKTRSSAMSGIMSWLHNVNTGIARELLTGETNISPTTMLSQGKSILVDAAPSIHGGNGSVVNAAVKWATQWSVLRREAKPTDFISVIFVDEAQEFVNNMDSHYLAQCRSHLGCMIFLSQSRHGFYAAMGGDRGRHRTDALLANFNLKILNALGTPEDAEWASDLCGREMKTMFGGSVAPNDNLWDACFEQPKVSTNYSTQMDRILEPNVFMHGLRTGGAANDYLVDAVIVKTGESFSDGRNWMWATLRQR